MTIAGESLCNDGVGVVLFMLLLHALRVEHLPSVGEAALMPVREAGGGLLFGALPGLVTYHLLKSIDDFEIEILLTLAAVMGGYALAQRLHLSGPLAMFVVGVLVGNHGRAYAMSHHTREQVDAFWSLVDQLLNSVLFVLLGMQMTRVALERGSARSCRAAVGAC